MGVALQRCLSLSFDSEESGQLDWSWHFAFRQLMLDEINFPYWAGFQQDLAPWRYIYLFGTFRSAAMCHLSVAEIMGSWKTGIPLEFIYMDTYIFVSYKASIRTLQHAPPVHLKICLWNNFVNIKLHMTCRLLQHLWSTAFQLPCLKGHHHVQKLQHNFSN